MPKALGSPRSKSLFQCSSPKTQRWNTGGSKVVHHTCRYWYARSTMEGFWRRPYESAIARIMGCVGSRPTDLTNSNRPCGNRTGGHGPLAPGTLSHFFTPSLMHSINCLSQTICTGRMSGRMFSHLHVRHGDLSCFSKALEHCGQARPGDDVTLHMGAHDQIPGLPRPPCLRADPRDSRRRPYEIPTVNSIPIRE